MLIRKDLLLGEIDNMPQGYSSLYQMTEIERMDKIVKFMRQKENMPYNIFRMGYYEKFINKSDEFGFYTPQGFNYKKIPNGTLQYWVALYLQN